MTSPEMVTGITYIIFQSKDSIGVSVGGLSTWRSSNAKSGNRNRH